MAGRAFESRRSDQNARELPQLFIHVVGETNRARDFLAKKISVAHPQPREMTAQGLYRHLETRGDVFLLRQVRATGNKRFQLAKNSLFFPCAKFAGQILQRARDQRHGPALLVELLLIQRRDLAGVQLFDGVQFVIQKHDFPVATPFRGPLFFPGVGEVILQRREQERPKLTARALGLAVDFFAENMAEKTLDQVLRIRRGIAATPNETVKRRPIVAAELRDGGLRLDAFGDLVILTRSDHAPTRGGERRAPTLEGAGKRFHAVNATKVLAVLASFRAGGMKYGSSRACSRASGDAYRRRGRTVSGDSLGKRAPPATAAAIVFIRRPARARLRLAGFRRPERMSDIQANLHLEIAHILFIDVVGYSKLLINEQSEAIQTLNQIVLQTEQVRAAESANELLRLATGDGMALVFRNHPEAPAACALEIARALRSHPQVQVRMGVHSGPVNEITDVNQRANIAGAGMNIAQRVMDCGDAGHILLSKRVADDLAQFREWQPFLHDLGEVEVKHGVRLPIVNLYREDAGNPAIPEKFRQGTRRSRQRRFALAAALAGLVALGFGASLWFSSPRPKKQVTAEATAAKSIAVLPLENFSDDKADGVFADGIQDDLLTSLAKIKDLKVISRTSVMSYRDKAARNLKQIGQELGVANVLEGSVRRVHDRVLVNVQLIDTATDQHIWAEHYDRTLADSMTLQGELASEIAKALQATLSPQEKARVESKPADNPEAYVAYLRGREAQLRPEVSKKNYLDAESFYKQAVALDPRFVLARARLSYMQILLSIYFEPSNRALLADARMNAEEALRIDPNSAEAHLSRALWGQKSDDPLTSRKEIEAALRLLPNDASLAMSAAIIQSTWGWDKDAAATYKRAAELGPREPKIFYNYGVLLERQGKLAEERSALNHALELAPDSVYFRVLRARAEVYWTGEIASGKAVLVKIPAGQDPDGRVTSAYCGYAAWERNFPEALKRLEASSGAIPEIGSGGFGAPVSKLYNEGLLQLWAGNRERARACFDSARWRFEVDLKDNPKSAINHFSVAYIYAVLGWKEAAMAEAAHGIELEKTMPPERRFPLGLAETYAWAGEPDLAWHKLQEALAQPFALYVNSFRLDPRWDPLRKDPRFQNFLATHKP